MSKSFLHTAPNKISSTNMTVSDTFITYLMAYSDELAEIFTDIFLPYQKFLHRSLISTYLRKILILFANI